MSSVPSMSFSELQEKYLQANGWTVEQPQPQDFWADHDRVYVCKGEYNFPLQFKKTYHYLQIIHLFKDLGIDPPQEMKDYYEHQKAKEPEGENINAQITTSNYNEKTKS